MTTPHSPLPHARGYDFTNTWFEETRGTWEHFLPRLNPRKVLEIGCYEGQSTCFLIDLLAATAPLDLHCVDSWSGGIEHQGAGQWAADMTAVEDRFLTNTEKAVAAAPHPVTLTVHPLYSDRILPRLLAEGHANTFDFIYVDGSHQAADVLFDAVMSFRLLRLGGVLAFDDYLWSEDLPYGKDPLRCPKPAIDAFYMLYMRKLRPLAAPVTQFYVTKISD